MVNKECVEFGSQGSSIRELFEYGKKRKAEIGADKVFDFSLGNPSVPTPKEYNDELIRILKEQDSVITHGYTSAIGDANARKAIADQLNKKYHANANENLIYLTCGAAASLTITLKAITDNADNEIIVFAPFFPEYAIFIHNAGAKIVICQPNDRMLIDFDNLEKLINKNTKALIIDSPNNPTGVVYDEKLIQKLADFLNEKQKEFGHDIYLISDEPYRELIYTDFDYPFITRFYDNSIVLYSFSKSLSLPGERIGYILVSSTLNDNKTVYNAIKGAGRFMGFVNAPSLFQFSIPKAVNMLSDINVYKENRELLYHNLTSIGYDVIYPQGAFYMFVKALEDDAFAFMEKGKKHELLLVPSDSFGVKGYVRIAYCVSKKTIEDSYDAFKELYEEYKK